MKQTPSYSLCGTLSLQSVFGCAKYTTGPLLWELAEHHQESVDSSGKPGRALFSMCYCIITATVPKGFPYKQGAVSTKTKIHFSEKWKLRKHLWIFYRKVFQVPHTIISSSTTQVLVSEVCGTLFKIVTHNMANLGPELQRPNSKSRPKPSHGVSKQPLPGPTV